MFQQIHIPPDGIQKSNGGFIANPFTAYSGSRTIRRVEQALRLAEHILQLKFLAQPVFQIHLECGLLHVFFTKLRKNR
ncbi:hypothetical protein D3C80_1747720 [compost metagenome]